MNSLQKTKKRSLHYDILRILACLMVIMTHSPIPHEGWYGPFLSGLSFFCAPCIGLFFMISGALLLNKRYEEVFDTKAFLTKRLGKVLCPTLFWSIIGFSLSYFGIKNSENAVLWFMFTLTGLYLLTPILYRWLSEAKKGEVEFYLLIWFISLCYPYLKPYISLQESDTSWIYYFHGFVGYYILGYYLAKYEITRSRSFFILFAFLFFSLILPILTLICHLNIDFYAWFWYLSASVALLCIVWWMLVKHLGNHLYKLQPIIVFVAKYSFGIYLVHVLILRNFLWKLHWIQDLVGPIQIFMCTMLAFLLSLFVSWVISKLKFGKYIIGV